MGIGEMGDQQGAQEQTRASQDDATVKPVAQDKVQSPQQRNSQPSGPGPLLPPIQQAPAPAPAVPAPAPSGHDQSQGSMQASTPPQTYAMQQHQSQPRQSLPNSHSHSHAQSQPQPSHAQSHAQSPVDTQPHYDAPPQQQPQSQYAQQPPPSQQHHHQPQHTAHQQQAQHQQHPAHYELPPPPQANGAPPGYAPAQQIPPPHHNQYQYQQPPYQPPPPPPANGDANGFQAQMRYPVPLPPSQVNGQQLSSARHKKEIKRRTKTGCLTCRKRRIKCDEGHPSCRNCQKSKRDCLGYDPIFKAQTGQPPNIQPQPGSLPPHQDSQSPHAPPPLAHQQYSNVPQGYMPASSAGYAPAPAMQTQLEQVYDYANSIDPALGAANSQPSHPPPPMPPPPEEYTTTLVPERNVRLITIDDTFHIDGVGPSFPAPRDLSSQPIPQHDIDAIRDLYLREYAPGLDRFFETDWYGTQGLTVLLSDNELLHYFVHCLERFRTPPSEQNKGLPSIEARLIWKLCSMAFSVSDSNRPPLPFIPRIEIVTHIILGTFMDPARVPSVPANMPDPKTQPDAYAFYFQDLFWHHLACFTTIRDDSSQSPSSGQDIANQLGGMRNILSMLENRDVLYSMAIARHFGGRMEHYESDKVLVGTSQDLEDPINKLVVAMGFLRDEEMQGTTQVVQRFCGMAKRGFHLQRLRPASAPDGYEKPGQVRHELDVLAGADGDPITADVNGHQEQAHQVKLERELEHGYPVKYDVGSAGA